MTLLIIKCVIALFITFTLLVGLRTNCIMAVICTAPQPPPLGVNIPVLLLLTHGIIKVLLRKYNVAFYSDEVRIWCRQKVSDTVCYSLPLNLLNGAVYSERFWCWLLLRKHKYILHLIWFLNNKVAKVKILFLWGPASGYPMARTVSVNSPARGHQ